MASAMMWAAEWRGGWRALGSSALGVTRATGAALLSGVVRSASWPSMVAPRASLAKRGPMDSATCLGVMAGASNSLMAPLGRVILIIVGSFRYARVFGTTEDTESTESGDGKETARLMAV